MPTQPRASNRPQRETDEVRSKLRIDDDDLDNCLVDQPEYFYQAAMASTDANATRDTLELEMKELTAELDQDIRRVAAADDIKLSENAIANQLLTLPRIKEKRRACLAARKVADEAEVLRDAFVQRSYALKDLVAIQNARLSNLGVERGSTGSRRSVGDQVQERAEAARLARDRSQQRYRPQNQGD